MQIEDAIHTALMTLKEGFEGKFLSNIQDKWTATISKSE